MKFFKDAANQVFAYEADGSQDASIPADQVPISQAEADALRFPPETHAAAQVRAEALLRGQRGPILGILDGLQATANTQWLMAYTSTDAAVIATADGFKAQAQQIEALKKGLRDAPTAINWDACADFEAMRQAGKAYYLSLVQGAPVDVITAFQSVA